MSSSDPPLPPPLHTSLCRQLNHPELLCDGVCVTDVDNRPEDAKPVARIALDVDGVLIPDLDGEHVPPGFVGYPYSGPNSIGKHIEGLAYLNPAHGRWMVELVNHGAELVWATTWEAKAATWIAPRLGLPTDIPFIEVGPYTGVGFGHSLKHHAVANYAGDRPLAWLDDHLGGKDHNWADDRTSDGIPTLLIETAHTRGLRREHIDILLVWLTAQKLPTTGIEEGFDPWQRVNLPDHGTILRKLVEVDKATGLLSAEVLHDLIGQRVSDRDIDSLGLFIQLTQAAWVYAHHAAIYESGTAYEHLRNAIELFPQYIAAIVDQQARGNAVRVAMWAVATIADRSKEPR